MWKAIVQLGNNTPLMAAITAWAVAQVIKVTVSSVMTKKFEWETIFASGGMPSSHSGFVTALSVVVGVRYGFDSVYFALSAALALVVMYDACGVRRAVGEQAKVLNRIIEDLKENTELSGERALKEILGHSPFQVIMGFLLGIAIGLAMALM